MPKKELFDWFFEKESTFTVEEVGELVERICDFNCGAIDDYLTKHANKTFEAWLEEKKN